ncbi:MAG: C1 family peptidase [Planctomycetota bacterium]
MNARRLVTLVVAPMVVSLLNVPAARAEVQATAIASTKDLPSSVDLRPEMEAWKLFPKRQGKRNTCSVFVTVGAMEYAVSKHAGEGRPLSVEYLNWACNQVIGNRTADRGQFFHDLLRGFEKHGICSEELMPYQQRYTPLEPSAKAVMQAASVRDLGLKVHWIRRWSKNSGLTEEQFVAIKTTLAEGWPVCAGSNHSRLLVGYVDDESSAGGRFITSDSAIGRYGEISYPWAREHIYDLFWVESPLSPQ